MTRFTFILISSSILFVVGCGGPYYQQPGAVVPVSQQQIAPQTPIDQNYYSPYQVYDNNGVQVVYYTDPYLHTSYYLDYALFTSLLNSGGYYGIHNYYIGHRSYIDGYYTRYHNTYHHVYYDSRSDGGRRYYGYRPSVPRGNGGTSYRSSVPTGARPSYRSSVPSGRTTTYTPSRTSVPSSSYRSSSGSSFRSSVPSGGGRRH